MSVYIVGEKVYFRFWGVFIEGLHSWGLILTSKHLCSASTWQVSTAVLSITAKAKKKEKEKKEKEEEKMEVVITHLFSHFLVGVNKLGFR